jgi:hypothetical protein
LISDTGLNVLTIHAEVEGILCLEMFERFLKSVLSTGAHLVPLGSIAEKCRSRGNGGHGVSPDTGT